MSSFLFNTCNIKVSLALEKAIMFVWVEKIPGFRVDVLSLHPLSCSTMNWQTVFLVQKESLSSFVSVFFVRYVAVTLGIGPLNEGAFSWL